MALLLTEPGATPPPPRTIAAAVLSCLRELARQGPVLVAVDDAQWLDVASASALEFALRRIGDDEHVAFLFSWRTEGERHPPLGTDGQTQRVIVGPLSLGALHRVVTAHLGHALSRPVLTRVHVVSGGNPFFALELARVAEQRGGPAAALELPLPASLGETLRERLDAVPADTTRHPAHGGRALDTHARPAREGARAGCELSALAGARHGNARAWRTTESGSLTP